VLGLTGCVHWEVCDASFSVFTKSWFVSLFLKIKGK